MCFFFFDSVLIDLTGLEWKKSKKKITWKTKTRHVGLKATYTTIKTEFDF